ncbi:hypothetical protein QQ045_024447 [Rhodiola kirilowii]
MSSVAEEMRIREELEKEVDMEMEDEIKEGIYKLALRLHHLYRQQQIRKKQGQGAGKKICSELRINIRMEASASPASRSKVIIPTAVNCDRFRFNGVSIRRKSKLTTFLKISRASNKHEEPDDDNDDDGKKRHRVATWKKWAVGITLSIILPSYRRKLGPLGILMNRVNEVLETTETMSEVVEDVAVDVKRLAEAYERRLPAKDQDGKLKEALDLVEKLAEETIKATDLAQELIDKVEEAEERLDDVLTEAQARIKRQKDATQYKR